MERNGNGLTQKEWLGQVDAILESRIGLGHSDLADSNFFDLWEDDGSPEEGAEECLAEDDLYGPAVEGGII